MSITQNVEPFGIPIKMRFWRFFLYSELFFIFSSTYYYYYSFNSVLILKSLIGRSVQLRGISQEFVGNVFSKHFPELELCYKFNSNKWIIKFTSDLWTPTQFNIVKLTSIWRNLKNTSIFDLLNCIMKYFGKVSVCVYCSMSDFSNFQETISFCNTGYSNESNRCVSRL